MRRDQSESARQLCTAAAPAESDAAKLPVKTVRLGVVIGPSVSVLRWRIANFDPRSALRAWDSGRGARDRLTEVGRVRVIWIFVLDRRQRPHCRRAPFDPCSALRARIRMAGEGRLAEVGRFESP
jgi:hypothetical protein